MKISVKARNKSIETLNKTLPRKESKYEKA